MFSTADNGNPKSIKMIISTKLVMAVNTTAVNGFLHTSCRETLTFSNASRYSSNAFEPFDGYKGEKIDRKMSINEIK